MHSSKSAMRASAAFTSALLLGISAVAAQTGQAQQQPGATIQGGQQVQPGQAGRTKSLTPSALRQQLEKSGFQNVMVLDAAYLVQATTADGDSILMFINPPSMQAARAGGQQGAAEGASTGTGAAATEQIGVGREMRPDTRFQVPPGTSGTTTRPPQQTDQSPQPPQKQQ